MESINGIQSGNLLVPMPHPDIIWEYHFLKGSKWLVHVWFEGPKIINIRCTWGISVFLEKIFGSYASADNFIWFYAKYAWEKFGKTFFEHIFWALASESEMLSLCATLRDTRPT